MKIKIFYKNFFVIILADAILLATAFYFAYLVRFDFAIPHNFQVIFIKILPFILAAKVLCFYFIDLYRGMWRYTSIADLFNVIKVVRIIKLHKIPD